MTAAKPWVCFMWNKADRQMRFVGRRGNRSQAQRLVEKPYRPGFARVRHDNTGEEWERRGGSWICTEPAARSARAGLKPAPTQAGRGGLPMQENEPGTQPGAQGAPGARRNKS